MKKGSSCWMRDGGYSWFRGGKMVSLSGCARIDQVIMGSSKRLFSGFREGLPLAFLEGMTWHHCWHNLRVILWKFCADIPKICEISRMLTQTPWKRGPWVVVDVMENLRMFWTVSRGISERGGWFWVGHRRWTLRTLGIELFFLDRSRSAQPVFHYSLLKNWICWNFSASSFTIPPASQGQALCEPKTAKVHEK